MAVVFTETFTGANGDPWSADWTTATGASSVVDIQSNRGRQNAVGDAYTWTHGARNSFSDDDMEIRGKVEFDTADEQYAVVRARTSGTFAFGEQPNHYSIEWQPQQGNILLRKRVSGSATTLVTLSSVNFSANLSQQFVFRLEGTALQFRWWNSSGSDPGTWAINTTDSAHSSGGLALAHYNGNASTARAVYWDDLVVDDMQAALEPVGITRTASFDVRELAATSRSVSFAVRQSVDTDRVLSWGIRAPAGAQRDASWSVRESVSTDRLLSYGVRETAPAEREASWAIRAAIDAQRAVSWAVRGNVTADRSAAWDVREATGIERNVTWDSRAIATADRALSWNVRESLALARSLLFDVRAVVAADRAASWHVRATVDASRAVLWGVRGLAGTDRVLLWDVEGVRVAVGIARALSWDNRALVAAERELVYDLRAVVDAGRLLAFDVRSVAGADAALLWSVRQAVGAERDAAWSVRAAVDIERVLLWDTESFLIIARLVVATLALRDTPTATLTPGAGATAVLRPRQPIEVEIND